MTLKSLATAAAPIAVAFVAVGLLFYFGGNQPGIKQAAMGLNGAVSPTAPAAFF